MANVTYSAGIATAYGAAVRGGYTGTYDDFCRQQAQYADSAAAVEQAKEDAEAAASEADTSKTAAAGSASAAATSAGQASTSATNAANSATEANASKNAAATSATEAGNSATAAAGSASDAQNSADDAQASAEAAAQSAASVDVHTDGNYPEMTVGTSEQLLSTQYVTDKTPYLFRTTGGGSDVGNREYVRGITGGTVAWNQLCNGLSATVPSGHKYLSKISTTWSVSASTGAAITGLTGGSDMVIDLTQLFGAAIADYIYSLEQDTAGAGVALFRKLFPNDYYPYNAGELKSVEGVSSHDMVGFNAYNPATGTAKVLGGHPYQITGTYTTISLDGTTITPDASGLFTPDANGTLTVTGGNGSDTCVHLVWSDTHNGEYKPYEKHTYALDSSLTLRGIPKLDSSNNLYYDGDVYAPDGTVTRRYGIVDLGTLSWDYVAPDSDFPYGYFKTSVSDKGIGRQSVICSKYVTGQGASLEQVDKACLGSASSSTFYVVDSSYSDAATFKTAMNGVMLVYELATPTTETAEPYTEIQICDDWGTEEYVSTSIVPVGHTTDYPANLRDKLQHLPDLASADGNYIVSQSGTQMTLAPLPIVIPAPPTTDGTYTFRATVSNGEPTLSWVEE